MVGKVNSNIMLKSYDPMAPQWAMQAQATTTMAASTASVRMYDSGSKGGGAAVLEMARSGADLKLISTFPGRLKPPHGHDISPATRALRVLRDGQARWRAARAARRAELTR